MGTYRNVMELLVDEEIERIMRSLTARTASYYNQAELAAYALNQLPSLYATSERGLDYQLERGRSKYREEITRAVQRAFAAIRRDPIRAYAPLKNPQQTAAMRRALLQLQELLHNDKLEWETLPDAVAKALNADATAQITWDTRYESPSGPAQPHRLPASLRHLVHAPEEDSARNWQAASKTAPRRSPTPSPGSSPPVPPSRSQQPPSRVPPPPPPRSARPTQPPLHSPAPPTAPEDVYGWDNPLYKG